MRFPGSVQRGLALATVVVGAGAFGASLGGVADVDATLQAATTQTQPQTVRVADRDDCPGRSGRHGGDRQL